MKKLSSYILVFFSLSMLAACSTATKPTMQSSVDISDLKKCPEPRPQMCTRDYRPVCASRDTGIRCITTPCPSSEQKTYGNACSACADASVMAYRDGACDISKSQ